MLGGMAKLFNILKTLLVLLIIKQQLLATDMENLTAKDTFIIITKHITILLLICLVFIVTGCSKKRVSSVYDISVHSIGSAITADSIFINKRIIHFKESSNNPKGVFSRISRLFIRENRMIIFDNKAQRVITYDTTGKFISSFDVYGRGPSESLQISDIYVESTNSIYLYSDTPTKIMKTDSLGNVLKELFLEKSYLDFSIPDTGKESFVFINIPSSPQYISKVVSDTIVSNHLHNEDSNNNEYIPGHFITTGNNQLISRRFDNNIYLYRGDTIISYCSIWFDEGFIHLDRIKKRRKNQGLLFEECIKHNKVFMITNAQTIAEYLIFNTNLPFFTVVNLNNLHSISINRIEEQECKFPINAFNRILIEGDTPRIGFTYDDGKDDSRIIMYDLKKDIL